METKQMDVLTEKLAKLQTTARGLSPHLIQVQRTLRSILGYKTNYGLLEDDTFVAPRNVSPNNANAARLQAHNLGLKANATLEQISLLITRVVEHEIPDAQHSRYRALMLKRRAKTCGDVKRSAKLSRKTCALERQAQQKQLLESEPEPVDEDSEPEPVAEAEPVDDENYS